MRVLLVGDPSDRARVRGPLTDAGVVVVAELAAAPAVVPDSVDAVVIAARGSRREAARDGVSPPAIDDPLFRDRDVLEPLTPREHEVLSLLADGLTNKGIAQALGISYQTVKFHVATVMAKLGARNRTEVVRRAVRRGLITL